MRAQAARWTHEGSHGLLAPFANFLASSPEVLHDNSFRLLPPLTSGAVAFTIVGFEVADKGGLGESCRLSSDIGTWTPTSDLYALSVCRK